jgi:diguanylate cyclase (GGDEF)-like protein/PAS domain S-box-containing protein
MPQDIPSQADARQSDTAPLVAKRTAQERVVATSDQFLRRFVSIWLLFALVLWAFLYAAIPSVQYSSFVMLAAGVPALIAVRCGQMKLARYLLIVPMAVAVLVIPLFANGARTPVLANMPMLLLVAGWMLGRRAMVALAVLFLLGVSVYWVAEEEGWMLLAAPLRGADVWSMVWFFNTALTGIVVWFLIKNYETDFQQQTELQRQLAAALKFNETILLNSPLPISVYAYSGQCVAANDAYAQLVGATREKLLAQNFHNIRAWHASGLHESCMVALVYGSPQRREVRVTSSFGKEVFVECRILPAPLNGENHLLIQFIDLTERKRMEEELRHYAFHDVLTQLPNRRLLLDRLEHAMHVGKRQNSHLAVLFLDLNRFKHLNDAYGHDTGDKLLIEVADRLRRAVRENDTVARLGGDEFVVLLEGLGAEADKAAVYVDSVADKLRHLLSLEYILGEIRHRGSVSIGVKILFGDGHDPDEVLKEADKDMYMAKRERLH